MGKQNAGRTFLSLSTTSLEHTEGRSIAISMLHSSSTSYLLFYKPRTMVVRIYHIFSTCHMGENADWPNGQAMGLGMNSKESIAFSNAIHTTNSLKPLNRHTELDANN